MPRSAAAKVGYVDQTTERLSHGIRHVEASVRTVNLASWDAVLN